MAGLYIHIPFCKKKCLYCDFYSITSSSSLIELFVKVLPKESALYEFKDPIDTVYFGGGTPSLLKPSQIEYILKALTKKLTIAPDAEITLEANPDTLTKQTLYDLSLAGINRISIGVQSLQNDELKRIGREHNAKTALISIENALAQFEKVSVDIMYALPGQTLNSLQDTLKQLLQFKLPHISAYELTIHKRTPLYNLLQKGYIQLPDEDTVEQMYVLIVNLLKSAGYHHYEVSNFALNEQYCQHNLNYWLMGDYLGLGPSAHSFHKNTRWENISDVRTYIRLVERGDKPVYLKKRLTEKDLLIESIMLGLRTYKGVELHKLSGYSTQKLTELKESGFVTIQHDRLTLTDKGLLLSNRIILELTEKIW